MESFVFELRGQVRDNEEDLSKVSPDDEREKIMEDLEALEEWLYEDGEDGGADAALSVYQDKRKEMQGRVKAIFTRLIELEKRPKAVKAARDVLTSTTEIMLLWPEERPQITEENTKEVQEVMESIVTWLDEKEEEQKSKEDTETPAFTSREVSNKLSKLHSIVSRLLKKKRPAPDSPVKEKVEGEESDDTKTEEEEKETTEETKDGEEEETNEGGEEETKESEEDSTEEQEEDAEESKEEDDTVEKEDL